VSAVGDEVAAMSDGAFWRGKDSRLSKWLAFAGFLIVLVIVAILLVTPPADGYEPSIYAGYPLYFWGLVVAAMWLGQLVILRSGLRAAQGDSDWRYGFLLTLLVATLLLFMPYIRGYPLYGRGDVLSHLGLIQAIQATGGAPFQNNYQNIHQLVLSVSYATGLEPIQVINAVAGIISLLSIGASFVLLARVFDRRRALLTLPFVVALVAGRSYLNPSPYPQSLLLLPFVLFLFVRTQQTESVRFRFALALTVVAVVIYHPLTALFLILAFCLHYAIVFAVTRTDSPVSRQFSALASKSITQLSVVVFVGWYYNFAGIIIRFETVTRRLFGTESGQAPLDTYGGVLREYSPALVDVASLATLRYGRQAILLGLGGLFVLATLVSLHRGGRVATPYLLTFGLGFTFFSGFAVVFLIVDLIGGFGRPLGFAIFFAVFTTGSLVATVADAVDAQSLVAGAVAVILLLLVTVSVFGLYPSPMAGETNQQVTAQDIDGAAWYLDADLQTVSLQEQGINMFRFEHALAGFQNSTVQRGGTAPPPRLNYTTHPYFGDSYSEPQVYVLTESARGFYRTVYPDYEQYWQYRPADYDRLGRDPTVSQVYDNGEIDIYLVEPTADS
jgi:hypothetical protein